MVHLRFIIQVIVLQLLLKKDIKIVHRTLALPVPYFFFGFFRIPYTHCTVPTPWIHTCGSLLTHVLPFLLVRILFLSGLLSGRIHNVHYMDKLRMVFYRYL